jgi:predicted DNA-binding protein
MADVATSVRIPADANNVLSALAAKLGKSKAQVIETALKELEERIFWAEVKAAFERTAADPQDAAAQGEESALWDRVSAEDFRDETW